MSILSGHKKKQEESVLSHSHKSKDQDGFLMVYENDKSKNLNEPGKRLYPSEILWQTFMTANSL